MKASRHSRQIHRLVSSAARHHFWSLHMCLFACERLSHMFPKSQVLLSDVCWVDCIPKLICKAKLCERTRWATLKLITLSFPPSCHFHFYTLSMPCGWLFPFSGFLKIAYENIIPMKKNSPKLIMNIFLLLVIEIHCFIPGCKWLNGFFVFMKNEMIRKERLRVRFQQ